MEPTTSDAHPLEDTLAPAKLEKLNLEIQELRSKLGISGRIATYLPFGTVFFGALAFVFTVYQFGAQQRQVSAQQQADLIAKETDQVIRTQDQIRQDVEELLRFTSDGRTTVSRTLFILEDLKYLLSHQEDQAKKGFTIPLRQKEAITESLIQQINRDCDFSRKPRDVAYSLALIRHWDDYSNFLRSHPYGVTVLLDKYLLALRELHKKDPQYFQTISYDALNSYTSPGVEEPKLDIGESTITRLFHFVDLHNNFAAHLDLLGQDGEKKKEYVQFFQDALCNRNFTAARFGVSLESLRDCSK